MQDKSDEEYYDDVDEEFKLDWRETTWKESKFLKDKGMGPNHFMQPRLSMPAVMGDQMLCLVPGINPSRSSFKKSVNLQRQSAEIPQDDQPNEIMACFQPIRIVSSARRFPFVEKFMEEDSCIRYRKYLNFIQKSFKQNQCPEIGPLPMWFKQTLKRQTIIFDLDETLVKAAVQKSLQKKLLKKDPTAMPLMTCGQQIMVSVRPFAVKMLRTLSQHFELCIFSLGHPNYVNGCINMLLPDKKVIRHILSREHTQKLATGEFVKDISILYQDRMPDSIIMVDNKEEGILQIKNVVPIPDYEGNLNDRYMPILESYLMTFLDCDDAPAKIEKDFKERRSKSP